MTRDKRVVWEYKVEPPNEVPICQLLPGGNVPIGIVGQSRLIELNRKNEVAHQVKLTTTFQQQ